MGLVVGKKRNPWTTHQIWHSKLLLDGGPDLRRSRLDSNSWIRRTSNSSTADLRVDRQSVLSLASVSSSEGVNHINGHPHVVRALLLAAFTYVWFAKAASVHICTTKTLTCRSDLAETTCGRILAAGWQSRMSYRCQRCIGSWVAEMLVRFITRNTFYGTCICPMLLPSIHRHQNIWL